MTGGELERKLAAFCEVANLPFDGVIPTSYAREENLKCDDEVDGEIHVFESHPSIHHEERLSS